jgi:hypothetical protein
MLQLRMDCVEVWDLLAPTVHLARLVLGDRPENGVHRENGVPEILDLPDPRDPHRQFEALPVLRGYRELPGLQLRRELLGLVDKQERPDQAELLGQLEQPDQPGQPELLEPRAPRALQESCLATLR